MKNCVFCCLLLLSTGARAQDGWTLLRSDLPSIRSIQFVSVDTGYLLCSDSVGRGRILRTTSAGAGWNSVILPVDTNATYSVRGISFFKGEGWITVAGTLTNGSIAQLLHSTDRGLSWWPLPFDSGMTLEEVKFTSSKLGYVLCFRDTVIGGSTVSHDKVASTLDGGNTWTFSDIGGGLSGFRDLRTFQPGILIVRGDFPEPSSSYDRLSIDSGKTWNSIELAEERYDGNGVWLRGMDRSIDTGQSWSFAKVRYQTVNSAICDTLGDAFCSVIGSTLLFWTKDYGISWDSLSIPFPIFFQSGQLLDSSHAFVAVQNQLSNQQSVLYSTSSGGVSDVRRPIGTISYRIKVRTNPLSAETAVALSNPLRQYFDVRIIDILGKECGQIFSGNLDAGDHSFEWDASHVPNGVYFCVVRSESGVAEMPLVVRH